MTPEEHIPVAWFDVAHITYPDVLDALSRKLITEEEARAICRRLFGLDD